jgi:capsular polysaccharide export protein
MVSKNSNSQLCHSTPHPQTIARCPPTGKVFLFLQGHPSVFWGELADALAAQGHRVIKVHLCLADVLFWGRRAGIAYRGRFRNWPAWLRALCQRDGVTDILYFADRLPYHVEAQQVARDLGIAAWATEFGYLRPDWLTFEADGMGTYSHFPKDRPAIEALAQGRPTPDMQVKYTHGFVTEAFCEVLFNLVMVFGRPFFPFYKSDKVHWPIVEYLSWLGELAQDAGRARDASRLETRAGAGDLPFNLIALQIETDYQIRSCSPYADLVEFLDEVITSFSRNAPADRHLVIKVHPLDSGLARWFRRIPRIAARHGVAGRVHVIRGGDLGVLIRKSAGVIVVNSTVGLHSLRHGVPLCVMGDAVYKVAGLAHLNGLDRFWTDPQPVDTAFFHVFRQALSSIQVKGSFFDPNGRRAAIREIVARFSQ